MHLLPFIKCPPLRLALHTVHLEALHVGTSKRGSRQSDKNTHVTDERRQPSPREVGELVDGCLGHDGRHPDVDKHKGPVAKHACKPHGVGRRTAFGYLPGESHEDCHQGGSRQCGHCSIGGGHEPARIYTAAQQVGHRQKQQKNSQHNRIGRPHEYFPLHRANGQLQQFSRNKEPYGNGRALFISPRLCPHITKCTAAA